MAITTLDGYIAASKQNIPYTKTATRTTVATSWFSIFDIAGTPGAGTLAGSSTAAGVVPTDATAGYPIINFSTGTGYLSRVEYSNTVTCRIAIYDRVFLAGAYAFNANTTLASQPSYSSRVPGGTDYTGLELWVETVTAFTGTPSIAVTYTNQAGTAAKTTGTVSMGSALTLGRCVQLPFAGGDTGIQKVESVVGTVASAGTFNVMVLRPLWSQRVVIANGGDVHDMLRTGLPVVYQDSSLYIMICPDSTSSGNPDLMMEVANG